MRMVFEVNCISAEGMAKLKEDAHPLETFRDPLRRTGDSLLTISGDFEAFILASIFAYLCENLCGCFHLRRSTEKG